MENRKIDKPKINLVIDIIMLLVLMAVAGLGLLMKYVLLPGYRINEVYGANTELLFLGLDRHQWGAIHLYLALFMVVLLILHIILHWDLVLCIFRRLIPANTLRNVIITIIGFMVIFLVTGPFFVKPEITALERMHNRNRVSERHPVNNDLSQIANRENLVPGNLKSPDEEALQVKSASRVQENVNKGSDHLHHHQYADIDINGTMTLSEISGKFNISIDKLAEAINVPADYSNERLGRLKRRYGFELEDLRMFVSSSLKDNNQ